MSKTVIKPNHKIINIELKEIAQYKQLIWSLAWRDLKVKYAQTFIGLLWALLVPLTTLSILFFVFGKVAKIDTGEVPYALFAITGLAGWTYFSTLLTEAGNALINSQEMIKKIYFPKLVIPLSKAISGLIEFGVTIFCLVAIMIYYGFVPGGNVIYFPLFVLLALLAGLTGGIWISALTVRYRDFKFVTPFIARMGLYITPVAYPASLVPEQYKALFYLNPMAGVVEGFRWSLLDSSPPDPFIWYSTAFLVLLFFIGLVYFGKVEKVMADLL